LFMQIDRGLKMPIYEYICEDCQAHFEKIVLNKTQEIACPKCAGKKNAIQLSVFSAANGSGNGASARSSGGSTVVAVAVAADVAATDRGRSARAMLISHSSLILFVTGAAILLVIPGPAVTYVVSRSIGYGRAAGLVSVMGIVTGTFCPRGRSGPRNIRAAGLFSSGVSVRKVSRRRLPGLSRNQNAAAK